ncbi:uncharacterized protein TNCV_2198311 [Trichonephila clavipes]|nr:uncharacterized protein TNCV_2198311 [Trichonephila clavipes]
MQKCPLSAKNLRLMVTKFEETVSLNVRSGRGRNSVSAEAIEKVALQVEEDKASNVQASIFKCSPCGRSNGSASFNCPEDHSKHPPLLSIQVSTCAGIVSHDETDLFSLQFLARLEVDPEWPWNILWTDEAHFHLDGSVNTHNCRIWETDNPHSTLQVPLHSPKVTVWCGFSSSFILGPYFSRN